MNRPEKGGEGKAFYAGRVRGGAGKAAGVCRFAARKDGCRLAAWNGRIFLLDLSRRTGAEKDCCTSGVVWPGGKEACRDRMGDGLVQGGKISGTGAG